MVVIPTTLPIIVIFDRGVVYIYMYITAGYKFDRFNYGNKA